MKVRDPVGPIQVLPPGLINLLQLKVAGYSPDAMRQDVQPTIDLEAWWLRAKADNTRLRYRQFVTGAPTTIGGFFAVLSPGLANLGPGSQAWWYVHNMTMDFSSNGVVTDLNAGISIRGGSQPSLGAADQTWSLPGRFIPGLTAAVPRQIDSVSGFWMPPNSIVGAYVGTIAAAVDFNLEILGFRYTELPI